MPARAKFTIALVCLALLGLAGIHGGPERGAAGAAAKIEAAARQTLAEQEIDWAQIRSDGQKVLIAGAAPDEKAAANLAEQIKTSIGPGGVLLGGVTRIDLDGVNIAPPIDDENFFWRAALESDALRLTGSAPSEEAKRMLVDVASRSIEQSGVDVAVLDDMDISPRTDEGVWLVNAATALRALAKLDSGVATNRGGKFALKGDAPSAAAGAEARRTMRSTAGEFTLSAVDIQAPPPEAPTETPLATAAEIAATEVAAAQAASGNADIADDSEPDAATIADDCQKDITRLLQETPVIFDSGEARISVGSRPTLSEAAAILSECGAGRVLIEGHTDDSGDDRKNEILSLERARGVSEALIDAGLNENIINVAGRGAANPIATNSTVEGRRKNRRIEIIVSPSLEEQETN